MFVPLHDDTPHYVIRYQWVTLALLVLNIGIFLLTGAFKSDSVQASLADGFGLVGGLQASNAQGEAPVYSGNVQPSYRFNNQWLAFMELGLSQGENYRERFGQARVIAARLELLDRRGLGEELALLDVLGHHEADEMSDGVLIFGASRETGLEVAKILSARGEKVTVFARPGYVAMPIRPLPSTPQVTGDACGVPSERVVRQ